MFGFLLRCWSCEIGRIICQNACLDENIYFHNWSMSGSQPASRKMTKAVVGFFIFRCSLSILFLTFLLNGVTKLNVSYIKTLLLVSTSICVTGLKSVSQPKSHKWAKTKTAPFFSHFTAMFFLCFFFSFLFFFSLFLYGRNACWTNLVPFLLLVFFFPFISFPFSFSLSLFLLFCFLFSLFPTLWLKIAEITFLLFVVLFPAFSLFPSSN